MTNNCVRVKNIEFI